MRKIKTTIQEWLGINQLRADLKTTAEFSANLRERVIKMDTQLNQVDDRNAEVISDIETMQSEVSDFDYKLDDKIDEYTMDDAIQNMRDDIMNEVPTREDIYEIISEEQEEHLRQTISDMMDQESQKDFDYDLVVSQVVRIIVEKLNN
jgi:hypothetical protein